MYSDRTDFNDFIIDMRSKWSDARALGSKITDEDFKDIIISSLSESWSSVTAPLYDPGMTSVDAMAHLQIWHTKSHRNQLTNNTQSTLALQTSVPKQESRSQLIYINPNCHRHGHTIEMCYWPGGGKEGQFPPGFSKRSGFRGLAANTQQGGFKSLSTANATTTSEESNQISTCMTMGDFKFKVSTISTLNKIHRPDNRTPPSFSVINQQTYNTIGVEVLNNISREILLACHMDPINKTTIPTHLAHARAETICQMMTENLVDRLNIYGELSIGGLCEDCIYGKHAAHPYSDNKPREKDVLECMHIDI